MPKIKLSKDMKQPWVNPSTLCSLSNHLILLFQNTTQPQDNQQKGELENWCRESMRRIIDYFNHSDLALLGAYYRQPYLSSQLEITDQKMTELKLDDFAKYQSKEIFAGSNNHQNFLSHALFSNQYPLLKEKYQQQAVGLINSILTLLSFCQTPYSVLKKEAETAKEKNKNNPKISEPDLQFTQIIQAIEMGLKNYTDLMKDKGENNQILPIVTEISHLLNQIKSAFAVQAPTEEIRILREKIKEKDESINLAELEKAQKLSQQQYEKEIENLAKENRQLKAKALALEAQSKYVSQPNTAAVKENLPDTSSQSQLKENKQSLLVQLAQASAKEVRFGGGTPIKIGAFEGKVTAFVAAVINSQTTKLLLENPRINIESFKTILKSQFESSKASFSSSPATKIFYQEMSNSQTNFDDALNHYKSI